MRGSRWRITALKLSVVAASVLFALLACEVSIRAADWYISRQARARIALAHKAVDPPGTSALDAISGADAQESADDWHWIVPDGELIYRLQPKAARFSRRGSQQSLAGQPPDGFRVLILGDSVAYGGKGFSDTLPGMLEENLRSDPTLQPVEILNSSIAGYTNFQEVLWLKKYGLEFEPNLVGVIFVMNDVYRFLHNIEMPGGSFPSPESLTPSAHRSTVSPFAAMAAETEPAGGSRPAIVADPGPPAPVPQLGFRSQARPGLPDTVQWLGRHSRLFQVLDRNIDIIRRTLNWYETRGYTFDYRADFYTAWQDEPWDMIDRQSAELAALGAKHGFRVFLVAAPFGDQYRQDYLARDRDYVLKPQRKLAGICAAHGFAYLDLYGELGREDFAGDQIHLNESGRRRAAASIAGFLKRERLVPNAAEQ